MFLGEESLLVEKFYGIIFIISYDKSVVKYNVVIFEVVDNFWFVCLNNMNIYDY